MAGHAFARIRFPGQNVLFVVVLVGLLIPCALANLHHAPVLRQFIEGLAHTGVKG